MKRSPTTASAARRNARCRQYRGGDGAFAGIAASRGALEPAAKPSRRGRALTSGDFVAFNQQLAKLTQAGLPVERGLRLIAADFGARTVGPRRKTSGRRIRSAACRWPRHSASIVVSSPDFTGDWLMPAFGPATCRVCFSASAGILEMLQRLRRRWSASDRLSPDGSRGAFAVVLAFLGMAVIPRFAAFSEFKLMLPWPTRTARLISHRADRNRSGGRPAAASRRSFGPG